MNKYLIIVLIVSITAGCSSREDELQIHLSNEIKKSKKLSEQIDDQRSSYENKLDIAAEKSLDEIKELLGDLKDKDDEIVELKRELEDSQRDLAVTKSQIDNMTEAAEEPSKPKPVAEDTPCPTCVGTGFLSVCKYCEGSGECSTCKGRGYNLKPNGSISKTRHALCKGTGECRMCSGSGENKITCSDCLGSKVQR